MALPGEVRRICNRRAAWLITYHALNYTALTDLSQWGFVSYPCKDYPTASSTTDHTRKL